jgi:site-specific DNA recombinase
MNATKREKEADQARLASLHETEANLDKMRDFEAKLKELCARIVPDLENCTYQGQAGRVHLS